MKRNKLTARVLLIVLLLAFATLACVGGGGEGSGSGSSATTEAAGVTATHGAEQYHQQLTAIYDQDDPTVQVTVIHYSTVSK